jgi:hypothetical protein
LATNIYCAKILARKCCQNLGKNICHRFGILTRYMSLRCTRSFLTYSDIRGLMFSKTVSPGTLLYFIFFIHFFSHLFYFFPFISPYYQASPSTYTNRLASVAGICARLSASLRAHVTACGQPSSAIAGSPPSTLRLGFVDPDSGSQVHFRPEV